MSACLSGPPAHLALSNRLGENTFLTRMLMAPGEMNSSESWPPRSTPGCSESSPRSMTWQTPPPPRPPRPSELGDSAPPDPRALPRFDRSVGVGQPMADPLHQLPLLPKTKSFCACSRGNNGGGCEVSLMRSIILLSAKSAASRTASSLAKALASFSWWMLRAAMLAPAPGGVGGIGVEPGGVVGGGPGGVPGSGGAPGNGGVPGGWTWMNWLTRPQPPLPP
eukprot:8000103-Pyramimonas_sp.AAC.1